MQYSKYVQKYLHLMLCMLGKHFRRRHFETSHLCLLENRINKPHEVPYLTRKEEKENYHQFVVTKSAHSVVSVTTTVTPKVSSFFFFFFFFFFSILDIAVLCNLGHILRFMVTRKNPGGQNRCIKHWSVFDARVLFDYSFALYVLILLRA